MHVLLKACLPAAICLGAAVGPATAQEFNLSFGVYAADKPSTMVRRFRPVLDALEARLSKLRGQPTRIRMQVAPTYERGIAHLVEGKVDFAQFGPASYIEAKEANPEISILAMEANNGTKIFRGIICVNKDSEINSIADLRGKSFAFGNKRSTIGRYLSQLYLLRHNIRGNTLKHYEYLGRHDRVGRAVGSGLFDAGALKENTFKKLVANGVPLRALGTFPNVTKPWIARGGLPKQVKKMLRKALFQITDKKALRALKKDGFVAGSDEDYAFIREAMLSNHLFFRRAPKAQESAKRLQ